VNIAVNGEPMGTFALQKALRDSLLLPSVKVSVPPEMAVLEIPSLSPSRRRWR